jgi:multiple sugar transport system permease protein
LWGIGGGMVILLAGLQNIPQEYYEAAVVDGAGALKRFRAVTIPLLSPALFFCLVTGVIGSFQVFTQSFVMTSGGPNDATLFYMLHLYRQAFDGLRMGYASALAWVLFVIILIFTLLQFRLSKWVYYEADSK